MTQDKKSATKAARELLLGDRLPVIERLAEAKGKLVTLQDREAEARAARRAGEDEVREQYDAAMKKPSPLTIGVSGRTCRHVFPRSPVTLTYVPPKSISLPSGVIVT
jgi:hypothetical protein